MRAFALAFTVYSLATLGVQAQQQERKLLDRVMRPDMSLTNSDSGKSFQVNKSYAGGTFQTKSFNDPKSLVFSQYPTNAYRVGRSATGNEVFRIPGRNLALGEASEVGKSVPTTAYGVKASPESGRTVSTGEYSQADKRWTGQGKSQDLMDQQQSAQKKVLSIDEIREILNKNK